MSTGPTTEQVKEQFEAAKQKAGDIVGNLTNEQKLDLYKLFKQATEGDCCGVRPGMFDLKGRYKHDAWVSLKGMSMEEAVEKYIELIQDLSE